MLRISNRKINHSIIYCVAHIQNFQALICCFACGVSLEAVKYLTDHQLYT